LRKHIRRVADGLFPTVVLEGQAPVKMSIFGEMNTLHVPGVSITIIHDGKIEWTKNYGVKRLGGDPVTTQTLFQVGSISKPVAAMGALRLLQEGRLHLDQNVNDVLTSWKLPENSFTAKTRHRCFWIDAATSLVHVWPRKGHAIFQQHTRDPLGRS
jgi:beta-lactamase family protein